MHAFCQYSSADYIFSELYNIYPVIKISMEKLCKINLLATTKS